MMHLRVSVPCITCPGCHKPKFLPHQSPLGTLQGLENQPTPEWPIIFVCTDCGRVSEHFWPPDDHAAPTGLLPDLWRIECVCDHENCGKHRAIYATYGEDSPGTDVRRILIRRSEPSPCSGHSFQLKEETMGKLERFPVP
jgi:hypothetical protein